MKKSISPNEMLAEQIREKLVSANLIAQDNKDFLAELESGKLKDSHWRAHLLDRIHGKVKSS